MEGYQRKARALLSTEADTRRPLIHHINADTSWLLQLPRDDRRRPYYNILLDPWLTGAQTEYSSWFHTQAHTVDSAFQTIAELQSYVRVIEQQASSLRGSSVAESDGSVQQAPSLIDAVACSFFGSDHVNEHTLRQLHSSVPVLVPAASVKQVRSWNHFDTVVQLGQFEDDWRKTRLAALPEWIGIGLVEQKKDLQGIHKGLVVSFDVGVEQPEAVIYMAHGIVVEDLAFIAQAAPELRVLALLHGLRNVKVGLSLIGYSDANLGAHNGLKAQRLFNARYWIGTHDEDKAEGGFTHYILTHFRLTLEQALERERQESGSTDATQREANWHQLENGEGMVLA